MSVLITAVVFGLVFALFSTQNTVGVPVNVGSYSLFQVPLYLLVLGSLLVGLIISWIISLFDAFGSFMTVRSRDAKLHESDLKIRNLQRRISELQVENARLSRPSNVQVRHVDTSKPVYRRENVFARLRRQLTTHNHPEY